MMGNTKRDDAPTLAEIWAELVGGLRDLGVALFDVILALGALVISGVFWSVAEARALFALCLVLAIVVVILSLDFTAIDATIREGLPW